MSRKDIFFGGSVLALAQMRERHQTVSQDELLNKYRHSVISVTKEHSQVI